MISFYADNVKVPAEGCKIFLRFKASKDQNKGHVYYAASATKENKPKQFKGNITRLNDSPNEIGTYYLWKSKDIDDDKNLVDFYNVIERHTKDNLCDWLKEDMKNRFLFRINELNA